MSATMVCLASRGTETILLADDEDGARTTIALILHTSGYTILKARDGEEALEKCRTYQGKIHLLIADVLMPRMSGRQLVDQVGALRPAAKVLYLSGYTDADLACQGLVHEDAAFLQKPFTATALARKVRAVLDSQCVDQRHPHADDVAGPPAPPDPASDGGTYE
jgi:two-component system cell cycle sensor histidine kinase/response regulator CckA